MIIKFTNQAYIFTFLSNQVFTLYNLMKMISMISVTITQQDATLKVKNMFSIYCFQPEQSGTAIISPTHM